MSSGSLVSPTELPESHLGLGVLLLRLSLLLLVITMMLVNPGGITITETELHNLRYRRPRQESYVPPWLAYFLIAICPVLIFCVPLAFKHENDTKKALLGWSLAMMITAVITEAIKLYACKPRPDFFYRCFPDGKVEGFICTGLPSEVLEGRKSFPSGHSSFSFCSFSFVSLWLMDNLGGFRKILQRFVLALLCILPLFLALGIAMSRCYDNHHHCLDVVVGSVLGLLTSLACYYYYYCRDIDSNYYIL